MSCAARQQSNQEARIARLLRQMTGGDNKSGDTANLAYGTANLAFFKARLVVRVPFAAIHTRIDRQTSHNI
eukprot:4176953-Heterocapsa_arctica.AAC.1